MGLYIQMHSMHGLFRGDNLELGRDEDTGGQILYVRYLAIELGKLPEVEKVDIMVRRIMDADYPGYADEIEKIAEGVHIVRLECGPRQYIKKVDLWPYIDEFVENCKKYINIIGRRPDVLHSNYADSGLVCARLSKELDIPQVHTGHSLGKPKMTRLGVNDQNSAQMDRIYHFSERLLAEQEAIDNAAAIVVSTDEERLYQYNMYHVDINDNRFHIISPGVNLDKFYPTGRNGKVEWDPEARRRLERLLEQELADSHKPMVFTISRLDYRKNLISLVKAYALDKELQDLANLVMVTGSLGKMGKNEEALMEEMEILISKNRLQDKVCLIRHLEYKTEGGEIYRIAYDSKGVFVNPALHEPFGITILEAGATGLPVVATNNGGPVEILQKCKCGVLVDPRDTKTIAEECRKILLNAELWEEYSNNGAARVKQFYTWEAMAKKELALFEEVVDRSF
jgi:sucrose-phosphate synthase